VWLARYALVSSDSLMIQWNPESYLTVSQIWLTPFFWSVFSLFPKDSEHILIQFCIKKTFQNGKISKLKCFVYSCLFWHSSLYGKFDYIDQISISKFRNQIIQYERQRTKPTTVYLDFLFNQPGSEHTQQTAVLPGSHLSRFVNQNFLHHCPVCIAVWPLDVNLPEPIWRKHRRQVY